MLFNLADHVEYIVCRDMLYIRVGDNCWETPCSYNVFFNPKTASEDIRLTKVGNAKPFNLQRYLEIVTGATTGIRVEDSSIQKRYIFDNDDCDKLQLLDASEMHTGDILERNGLQLVLSTAMAPETLICWDFQQRKVHQVYLNKDVCHFSVYRMKTLWSK